MKRTYLGIGLLIFALASASAASVEGAQNPTKTAPPAKEIKPVDSTASTPEKLAPGLYAHFETTMGEFTCVLYDQFAPNTVGNFVQLAQGTKSWTHPKDGKKMNGVKYYDGVIFHRVINGFMIQSGDPTGTGMGGPGYAIPDEISPTLRHDREGRLSMANTGRKNSGGAQFFITLGPRSNLDGGYAIFGQVVRGMDVVKKIGAVRVKAQPGMGEISRPIENVTIKKVRIERVKA